MSHRFSLQFVSCKKVGQHFPVFPSVSDKINERTVIHCKLDSIFCSASKLPLKLQSAICCVTKPCLPSS